MPAKKVLFASVIFAIISFCLGVGFVRSEGWKSSLRQADWSLFKGRFVQLYFHETIPERVPMPLGHAYDWVGDEAFLPVAHGMGPQLFAGINQLATFEEGKKRGFRIFEVDLAVTVDHKLVCFHGAAERELDTMTYSEYMRRVRSANGSPCIFGDLIAIATADPKIRFVLDVKNRFDEAYALARAQLRDSNTAKSFIPQVYFFDQLQQFRKDQVFPGEIFTSYKSHLSTQQIIETARKLHVDVVTLTRPRIAELNRLPSDLIVLAHPVDDPFQAAELRQLGVRGIYTSYVAPNSVPEVFARSLKTVPRE